MNAPLKKIVTGSAVDRVAQALRSAVLSRPEGTFLGSEETLVGQLGVSGPTLRQAARLLESEQLLEIRRGIGGGYFVRRPTMEVVTRLAATYLQTQAVSVADAMAVTGALLELRTRLAVACEDEALREELRAFGARPAEGVSVEIDSELGDILSRMAGNVALRMVMTIFNSYALLRDPRATPPPPELRRLASLRPKLIEAVLAQDAERAVAVAAERFEAYREVLVRQVQRIAHEPQP